ncbi:hypothetical protein Hanom_Chr11g01019941 [Helianthus anomalus]
MPALVVAALGLVAVGFFGGVWQRWVTVEGRSDGGGVPVLMMLSGSTSCFFMQFVVFFVDGFS